MFEGDMIDGELEIGQVSATINNIMPVKDIINEIITEFNTGKEKLSNLNF